MFMSLLSIIKYYYLIIIILITKHFNIYTQKKIKFINYVLLLIKYFLKGIFLERFFFPSLKTVTRNQIVDIL